MNVREFTEGDAKAVAALIAADEEHFFRRPSRLRASDILLYRKYHKEAWVWEDDGLMVAAATYGLHGDIATVRGAVSAKDCGIGTDLLVRGEAFALENGSVKIHAGAPEPDAAARALFEGRGYHEVRRFYEMAVDGYERKLLYKNEGGYISGAVSPDRRYLALDKAFTNAAADIDLLDRTTGKITPLVSHQDAGVEVANAAQGFSPDGKSFYYTTDKGSQFAYLMRYDLATGKSTEVLSPRPHWDVQGASFSRDGRWFSVAINNDAKTELRVFEAMVSEEQGGAR